MSFNIFWPATKDSIRVGYISTDRGFVEGVSICEANDYAKLNPGTQFVFRNRKYIKYLNINEVNKLTANDLLVGINTCEGLQLVADCPPPQVYFYGGGGVGVQGNPVFGLDGSLLAVDLVSGGFGYQYPPIVEIKDGCGIGAGALARAVLGEVTETVEVYDQEGDFEEYEICEPSEAGYGNRYGPDGELLGGWDPTLYANLSKDPIRREIQKYQEVIQKNPWWTTRKAYAPLQLTSSTKSTRTKFDVTHPAWNEFMNTHAISPVPPSNVKGSDFAGIPFTFEWEEDFPYDGEYIFRGLCDNNSGNKAEFYLDNIKIIDLQQWSDPVPSPIRKTVTAGVHRIRFDLLNGPIYETKITQQVSSSNLVDFNVFGQGRVQNLSFTFTPEDGSESFVINGVDKNKKTRIDKVNVKPNVNYKVIASSDARKHKSVEQGLVKNGTKAKEAGEGTSNKIFADYLSTDNDNDDMQITVGKGIFTSSNKRKIGGRNTYDLTFRVDAQVGQTNNNQSQSSTPQIKSIFNTIDYINKADRPLWRTNVYARGGFINEYGICPFDTTVQLEDNPYAGTHRIVWNNINFPVDGNYIIEIEVDDNVNLTFTGSGGETVINKRGFSGTDQSTGKSTETRYFKAGNYAITADLEQIPGGKFGFSGTEATNPMALAINVQTSFFETQVISAKSWYENPMGIAFTIDAPRPPIPQEPIPLQEGRCPNNPIWTTRFPGAKEKWWPVILGDRWSKFMNRYAISPVPPLSENNSEGSGVVWRNSWNLDIPYDGFYALKGTLDNLGRILIDGVEISKLNHYKDETPDSKKFFLSKGRHEIQVEVENYKNEIFKFVDKKIFSSLDWVSATKTPPTPPQQTVDVNFYAFVGGDFANSLSIDELGINISKGRGGRGKTETGIRTVQVGKVYSVKLSSKQGNMKLRTRGDNVLQAEDYKDNNWKDAGCVFSEGKFFDLNRGECKFVVGEAGPPPNLTPRVYSGTVVDGVTYEGPELVTHNNKYWNKYLNSNGLAPLIPGPSPDASGKKKFTWKNVTFFESGQYNIKFIADNDADLYINGVKTLSAQKYNESPQTFSVNITKGTYTIVIDSEYPYTNQQTNTSSYFAENPTGFALDINKKVSIGTGITRPWTTNPIGISAILIPPPCPKRVRGKGVVIDVEVFDPGNGYPSPITQTNTNLVNTYPTSLRLKSVLVGDPGINYNCGVDQIQITPNNGAVLDYVCDTFGRIVEVKVLNPGLGFTTTPEITMLTETGINVTFIPQFEIIRDPIGVPTEKLIQVTDLVGLKQTGYADGRAYYGSVFYKEGVRYAGFYETAGDLVQIYDTLQESIDAKVTTPASAILRQGTDITSNDPRLNIPGTPENLI